MIPKKLRETLGKPWVNLLLLLLGIYIFIGSLEGLKSAWEIAFAIEGKEQLAESFIQKLAGNPVSGLCVGLLATSLVQSSSGVVAATIATVGAGILPISFAVPIILGANIGTTITTVLVTMGYTFRKTEFTRAVPAALLHDMFNIINVAIFFILEVTTHILSRSAVALANWLGTAPGIGMVLTGFPDFTGVIIEKPIVEPIIEKILGVFGLGFLSAGVVGLLSFLVLLGALGLMSGSMRRIVKEKATEIVDKAFRTSIHGVGIGTSLTWLLQSSSVATSLIIPFAASDTVKLDQVYPYMLGSNIGTTIDPGQIVSYVKFGVLGLQVGLAHVMLNVFGVSIWLGLPKIKEIPMTLARRVGGWITARKVAPGVLIAYVAVLFYLIPIAIILLS